MARDADLYDFFVSYARADDQGRFVSGAVDGILAEQRKFKGRPRRL